MSEQLPVSITLTTALLTAFFIFISALGYAVDDTFLRTRLLMTSFFCFIVLTLTISFWRYTLITLPFTVPACLLGIACGYFFGVRAAERRVRAEGLAHYMEHFAHVHKLSFKRFSWWNIINFYSIMGALVLINLVGFSTVLHRDNPQLAIATSVVGAFLLGTILPYLYHLWSIKPTQPNRSTTSE